MSITPAVKAAVFKRDDELCVWCGLPGEPNAHCISRAQGGLGVEENVLTLCPECHRRYDQSPDRKRMRAYFEEYLSDKYPGWGEDMLIYRK